jgi:hypothetical protein
MIDMFKRGPDRILIKIWNRTEPVVDLKVQIKSANPKEGPRNKCISNILSSVLPLYTRVSKLIINHCSYTLIVFILGNYIAY